MELNQNWKNLLIKIDFIISSNKRIKEISFRKFQSQIQKKTLQQKMLSDSPNNSQPICKQCNVKKILIKINLKMCGIFCIITRFCQQTVSSCEADTFITKYVDRLLSNRGTELTNKIQRDGMIFQATVLWQQGKEPTQQPLEDDNHLLLFNGDLFMERENLNESDTQFLFELLKSAENENLVEWFKVLRGPYSLIWYDKRLNKLYFGRDSLGRNTLLIGKDMNSGFLYLTSVIEKPQNHKVVEVPPLGMYSIDLNKTEISINLHPWKRLDSHEHYLEEYEKLQKFLDTSIQVKKSIEPEWLFKADSNKFCYNFQNCFDESWKAEVILENYLKIPEIVGSCQELLTLLQNSVKERILNTPNLCRNCIKSRETLEKCDHPKIGILFSGGIDCSILAVIADKFVDKKIPIDLLNVAFEKVNHDPKKKNLEIDWNVPDRITARETFKELQKICPDRVWNLVEVNIDRKELNHALKEEIIHLVYPLISVLDESLGGALWFAARGAGLVSDVPYQSTCRVLLIGSGADELFGGYTRHRNAFKRGGAEQLENELTLDWVRLPGRNLARDDRIIGDHGITARAPYVQEQVVNFIQNLSSLQKCYHQLEPGIGDKLLLRLCGFKLGLKNCCQFKKRALQFGSRIADRKQNAKQASNCFQNDD